MPPDQLPTATGAREARRSVVRLGGPPLGGALYNISRVIPFAADAVSYAFSTSPCSACRTPFEEERRRDTAPLRTQFAEGFRYMWSHSFLRTTAFVYGAGNFLTSALFLLIVVIGNADGLTPGEIGLLSAVVGAGTLVVGSLASPLIRRLLAVRTILLLELWTWLATWAFVVWPHAWVLGVWALLFGIAAPVTDSVVVGYRIAMTPDRLVGRVESAAHDHVARRRGRSGAAGRLAHRDDDARATVAVFAAGGFGLALWGTLSSAIRNAPSLSELEAAEAQ